MLKSYSLVAYPPLTWQLTSVTPITATTPAGATATAAADATAAAGGRRLRQVGSLLVGGVELVQKQITGRQPWLASRCKGGCMRAEVPPSGWVYEGPVLCFDKLGCTKLPPLAEHASFEARLHCSNSWVNMHAFVQAAAEAAAEAAATVSGTRCATTVLWCPCL